MLEKAPEAWRGGNGFFTAGGFRFAFASFDDIRELVGDLSDEEAAVDGRRPLHRGRVLRRPHARHRGPAPIPTWPCSLVRESQATVQWMNARGIRWIPMFGRQAYKVGGKFRFWGGLVLEAVGGGPG